jgi:hypothetical protein
VIGEYLPAAQSVHGTLPVVVLYFPATQAIHEPASGPVNPALQVRLERALLPAGDVLSAGQSMHASVPVVALYLAATHVAHDVADRSDRY